MNQKLVSIIVSVYNIENYLPHCLKSIREQTYNELEIILVDDGSTDQSGAICDDFAKKNSRCRVIHQTNQGLAKDSSSRMSLPNGYTLSKLYRPNSRTKKRTMVIYFLTNSISQ